MPKNTTENCGCVPIGIRGVIAKYCEKHLKEHLSTTTENGRKERFRERFPYDGTPLEDEAVLTFIEEVASEEFFEGYDKGKIAGTTEERSSLAAKIEEVLSNRAKELDRSKDDFNERPIRHAELSTIKTDLLTHLRGAESPLNQPHSENGLDITPEESVKSGIQEKECIIGQGPEGARHCLTLAKHDCVFQEKTECCYLCRNPYPYCRAPRSCPCHKPRTEEPNDMMAELHDEIRESVRTALWGRRGKPRTEETELSTPQILSERENERREETSQRLQELREETEHHEATHNGIKSTVRIDWKNRTYDHQIFEETEKEGASFSGRGEERDWWEDEFDEACLTFGGKYKRDSILTSPASTRAFIKRVVAKSRPKETPTPQDLSEWEDKERGKVLGHKWEFDDHSTPQSREQGGEVFGWRIKSDSSLPHDELILESPKQTVRFKIVREKTNQ